MQDCKASNDRIVSGVLIFNPSKSCMFLYVFVSMPIAELQWHWIASSRIIHIRERQMQVNAMLTYIINPLLQSCKKILSSVFIQLMRRILYQPAWEKKQNEKKEIRKMTRTTFRTLLLREFAKGSYCAWKHYSARVSLGGCASIATWYQFSLGGVTTAREAKSPFQFVLNFMAPNSTVKSWRA